MMSHENIRELLLPAKHIETRLINANETYMLAARGTFKTSRGIALYCLDNIYAMPRSSGAGIGLSFEHLGDNTLPPLLQAFEEFGFMHGEHYVVGKKPPKHWPKPYLGIINEKYDHIISWHNGTAIHLVSLAKRASANGISVQWGFFDECKFMKEHELVDEIFPIFRGNDKYFKHLSNYLSKFFATDKLADPAMIKWLLKKRELVNPEKTAVILSLALEMDTLKNQLPHAGINAAKRLRAKISDIEKMLHRLRANLVHVAEISAYDVLPLLGEKWLADKRRNMGGREFAVAVENADPDKPGQSFYPDFEPTLHVYDDDMDVDTNRPLIIGADYQHSVAPIPICQLIPADGVQILRYVDEVFTLAPQGLMEAVQLFCDKYATHQRRVVYYIYDHTAIGRRSNSDLYADMVKTILKRNGWAVMDVYTGQAPGHYQKYIDTREWLVNGNPVTIRINRKCKKLITSITGAAARVRSGQTIKDKADEQESGLDQSETTHFSDAFDMINHAVIKMRMIKPISSGLRAGTH